jgi:ATP-dependent DNA helicase RecG
VALYDDRLEIISPGELHFGLTPEKLYQPHESRPWNPWIAKVFYRRGLIETWGRGTLKIAERLEEFFPLFLGCGVTLWVALIRCQFAPIMAV